MAVKFTASAGDLWRCKGKGAAGFVLSQRSGGCAR